MMRLPCSTGRVRIIRTDLGFRYVVDAHKEGEKHVVEAEILLTAFIGLRKNIRRLHNL